MCALKSHMEGLKSILKFLLQAFGLIQQEFGISPSQTPTEVAQTSGPDRLASLSYLTRLQDQLQKETPVIVGKGFNVSYIMACFMMGWH